MSDFNSSLPIRTENNGDAVVKITDGTITSRLLTVNADGSINITDNSGSITVDGVDLDIRDLVFATDKVDASGSVVALDAPTLAALESITVQNPAGAGAVNIQDGGNSITVDGTVELGATTLAALESITVQNPSGAGAVNIQDGGNSITVDAVDLDIRDLVAATDSVSAWLKDESGNAFTLANPLPVEISEDPGTPLHDYKDASAIAAASSDTHTYTATSALKLKSVMVAASGKAKFEVKAGPTGSEVTIAVSFLTAAIGYAQLEFGSNVEVASGDNVLVIATNRDNQAQDLYSTINGILA